MRKAGYIVFIILIVAILFAIAVKLPRIEPREQIISQNIVEMSGDSDDSVSTDIVLENEVLEKYVKYDYSSWPEVEYPNNSMETIDDLLSYEDTGWRKAYAEIIFSYETEGGYEPWDARWDLYDVDGSGVPEFLYMPSTSGGGRREYIIYAFNDGKAECIGCFFCYGLAVCFEDGLICCDDLKQGEYYNSIICLEEDQVVEEHDFYTNDGAVETGKAIYMIDDANVTREEFYDRVLVPDSAAQDGRWEYPIARFSLGEYDDIFYMGIYPGVSVIE